MWHLWENTFVCLVTAACRCRNFVMWPLVYRTKIHSWPQFGCVGFQENVIFPNFTQHLLKHGGSNVCITGAITLMLATWKCQFIVQPSKSLNTANARLLYWDPSLVPRLSIPDFLSQLSPKLWDKIQNREPGFEATETLQELYNWCNLCFSFQNASMHRNIQSCDSLVHIFLKHQQVGVWKWDAWTAWSSPFTSLKLTGTLQGSR